MDIKEFKDNVSGYITQAQELAGHVTDNQLSLAVDISSIGKLDVVIERVQALKRKGLVQDDVIWNISVVLGTLLGEMIIREHKFQWAMNDEGIPVVETDDKNQMSPITKIYKILTDDDGGEGSASSFYNGFKALQKYYSMSDEEREKLTTYIE